MYLLLACVMNSEKQGLLLIFRTAVNIVKLLFKKKQIFSNHLTLNCLVKKVNKFTCSYLVDI